MEEPALPCANPNSVRFPVLVSETIIFQNAKYLQASDTITVKLAFF
jgi:hypothetical protein